MYPSRATLFREYLATTLSRRTMSFQQWLAARRQLGLAV